MRGLHRSSFPPPPIAYILQADLLSVTHESGCSPARQRRATNTISASRRPCSRASSSTYCASGMPQRGHDAKPPGAGPIHDAFLLSLLLFLSSSGMPSSLSSTVESGRTPT
ncbi:uncharacterized protein J3R85_013638 [Psidium guajava]|nr:uncharacterized protein J3R85_013638 [Psidium guajava]